MIQIRHWHEIPIMPLTENEIRKQVVEDFKDKLILEKKLRKRLRRFDSSIVNQFKSDMLRGSEGNATTFQQELQEILNDHYQTVSKKFKGRILDRLFKRNATLSTSEKEILENAIKKFIKRRSINQAKIILDNTQKNMRVAAQAVISETADQIERAVNASALLSRKLRSRETGIVSLETQAMAEARKSAEADMFANKEPLTLQSPKKKLEKEWVTMGDERVRSAHVNADSQLQPIDDFFIVMGQQLRFPGDTSFGATAANVINCRCNAVYNEP